MSGGRPYPSGGTMPEDWYYHALRFLHPLGAFTAFLAATVALLSVKGGRRHIVAGRWFLGGMTLGATAGILMSIRHSPPVYGLLFIGLMTLSFIATGYLAPGIGRGSRRDYRWDRAAMVLGVLASVALIWNGLLDFTPRALIEDGVIYGGIGLAVSGAHARWRGPADPSRWRVEHLTSMLAAYMIVWSFIFELYIRVVLPRAAQVLIPSIVGSAAILWARRRFGTVAAALGVVATATAGAA
jgi:hypothetical protein